MRAPSLREEAKQFYTDKENVKAKWLDQYGSVTREGDYQHNRACLSEVFNMLDVVMDRRIEEFRHTHAILEIDMDGNVPVYTFASEEGGTVTFKKAGSFAARVRALRAIGYPISDELFYDTRFLRNETTHGNRTIVLQHIELDYEMTRKAMLSMADALICLGMLDPSLREPTFEVMRIREGDTLFGGAYTVGRFLGEGGVSRVYEAVLNRTGTRMAVKELKPEAASEEVMRHEERIIAGLCHRLIPQFYDSFAENGTRYLSMALAIGMPLDRWLEKEPHTREELDKVVRGICEVLEYLHSTERGIVFADLSPDNILVDEEGNPHVIDYGACAFSGEKQAVPSATPGYSAPEVFLEEPLDARADIYSLGKLLQCIYRGPEAKGIQDVIARCTAHSPRGRYQSVKQVREALFPGALIPDALQGTMRSRRGRLGAAGKAMTALLFIAAVLISVNTYYSGKGQGETQEHEMRAEKVSFAESGLEDHRMDWGDENLEAGMRTATGIQDGEIMLSDVYEMTELSLANCGIRSIDALGELTNLEFLDLNFNAVEDVSPLAGMTCLRQLSLQNNRIADIRALGSLTALHSLDVGGNRITDLSVLEELPQLLELAVNDNPARDIGPVLTCSSLVSLNVCGLGLQDCAWVSSFPALEKLYLSDNAVSDLAPLSECRELTSLYLQGNGITDLTPLAGLSGLEYLDIQDNALRSPQGPQDGDIAEPLSPLEGMKGLVWLDARRCGLTDLSPLESMTSLTYLDASLNAITDLSPLKDLRRLSYLDLSGNGITKIDSLARLTSLSYLDLRNNQIEEVKALEGLTGLKYLYMGGNPAEDQDLPERIRLLDHDLQH
ncbi:MAG: leucine-rich repeat domain-containing protein [Lachnospiraceae bacterium]|nr:leucine-rich repeat domain-containing protein [Lachnospiraceae bacterium]